MRGVLAETLWKLVATCGKVSADGWKTTEDGSGFLRGPDRGAFGRTGALLTVEVSNETS